MRRLRSTRVGFGVAIALCLAGVALAYWVTSGAGSAAGAVGTLNAPSITSATSPSSGSATITWSPATMTPSSASTGITYAVQRRAPSASSFADLSSGGCSGSKPYSASTISCTDATITTGGSYQYRVVARYGSTASWTATSLEASVAVSVGSGTIALTPSMGHVGDTIAFTGSGFPASSPVSATFDGSTIAISPSNRSTNGAGSISSTSFIVPMTTAGAHIVTISAGGQSTNATLTVTPKITLTPTSGVAGASVSVSGTGFAGSSSVSATFAGANLPLSGTTSVDAKGSFSAATFAVPNAVAGPSSVIFTDSASNSDTATFTIPTPTISLTSASGTVGATTSLSGSNFPASSAVSVTYDGNTVASATTDATGAFSGASITVPASTAGNHTIGATVLGRAASAAYAVAASITLTPTSGVAGSTATITGAGFAANRTISATFGGTTVTLSGGTSDANGGFSATYTVPNQTPGVSATVVASDNVATPNSASASFTIPTPSITLTPATGHVGDTVSIAGSNFPANAAVTATFAGTTVTLGGTTTTTASGTFSATFAVPTSTAGAKSVVVAAGTRSGSGSYTVTPAILLSPTNGFAGTSVSVSGSGFAASSSLSATFGGSAVTLSATTTSNATGGFSGATFTVPNQLAGDKDVIVTAGGGSGTATYTLHVRGFAVTQQPTAATAGAPASTQVILTATVDGVADSSYAGNPLTWSGTGAASSPSNAAPTLPTNPTWSNGQATFPITLTNAGSDSLSVSDGTRTGSFATITVSPGTISKLAWNSFTVGAGTLSSPCLFSCSWSGSGKTAQASFRVAATDAYGNIGNAIGAPVAVGLTANGSVPSSVTIPGTGASVSPATTYTTPGSSWTSDTLKASASGFSDLTATINR